MNKPSRTEFAADASPAEAPIGGMGAARPRGRGLGELNMQRLRAPLMLGGIAIVLVLAIAFWLSGGRYETTDDAYVRVAGVEVSSNVAGRVVEVDVKENQRVHAGDVLFRLDPTPFDIAVETAQAQVADARQQLQGDLAGYRQKEVALKNAQDAAQWRERDRVREQGLMQAGAVSKAEYDQAAHEADAARLQVAAAQQDLAAARARLGGATDTSVQAHPGVRSAVSQLARAELQKSWTVVKAPQDGRVTKVEQLQVGDYINASTPVFHLVADRTWIEAAFKENQLRRMRIGQPAEIRVDAYPGYRFEATVESLAPGTDSTFAMLPAENATGNWVKVVQRLPVRLVFRGAPPIELQGGLSAKVKVDTGYKRTLTGSQRVH